MSTVVPTTPSTGGIPTQQTTERRLSNKEMVKVINQHSKDVSRTPPPNARSVSPTSPQGGSRPIGKTVASSPSSTPLPNSRTITSNPMRSPSTYFRQDPEKKKLLDYIDQWLDSFGVQGVLGCILMISLFLPDLFIILNVSSDMDIGKDIIMLVIFILFVMECVALVLAKERYFLGFFFWMDVLGTLSMVLDISWTSDALGFGATGDAQLLRAARSAKVGAKSGRLAKLTKLFKLLEQCWSQDHELYQKDQSAIPPAKQIARALSGVLSRRVAALVLTLILVTPILMYADHDNSYIAHMNSFELVLNRTSGTFDEKDWTAMADEFKDHYAKNSDIFPMDLVVKNADGSPLYEFDWSDEFGYVRDDSVVEMSSRGDQVEATFNVQDQLVAESLSSVLTIIVVMFALVGFTASFQQAVDELVVMPLERMMDTLKSSASSILRSVQAIAHEKMPDGDDDLTENIDGEVEEVLETNVLEAMIEKLAKITSHILPGAENIYVNEANMDDNTKDWIADQYMNAESKESRKATKNMTLAARTTRVTANSPMQGSRAAGGSDRGAIRSTVMRKSKNPTMKQQTGQAGSAGSLGQVAEPVEDWNAVRVQQLEAEMSTWTFDVESLKLEESMVVMSMIFDTFEVSEECNIDDSVLSGFFGELQRRYINTNTFHNWYHAVDVTHTVFRFVVETQAHTFLMPLETFSLLVSAVAHDVGHPGYSNPYLIKTKHELAIVHNDQSPLENMHCATLYEVVSKPKFDIFGGLEPDQWRAVRKIVISAILGTDMIHHFPLISKMQVFYEMHGTHLQNKIANGECNVESAPGMMEAQNRSFMIDAFLHAADISNPVKSFDICKKWALLVVDEFFNQGDLEKKQGLDVSPMCDRLTTNVNNMQVGFIEFVVFPLYDAFVKTFPTLEVLLRNIVDNNKQWTNRRVAEVKHQPEEVEKMNKRFAAFQIKANATIEQSLPMCMRIEHQKQQYNDMLKLVSSTSRIFSMDSYGDGAESERTEGRRDLKSKLSSIQDGDCDDDEEEDDDAPLSRESRQQRAGSRRNLRKVNSLTNVKDDGGGKGAPDRDLEAGGGGGATAPE